MDEDPFEDWERYPADVAEERQEYRKLAWYSAPFGSAGLGGMVLAVAVDLLRRLGHQVIRIAFRLKLV